MRQEAKRNSAGFELCSDDRFTPADSDDGIARHGAPRTIIKKLRQVGEVKESSMKYNAQR